MTIFELWKKIGVPENVVSATLELDFNDKIFQNLYPIYQRNHELFFQNVLLREDSALWFFLIYMPRSGNAGSYGNSISSLNLP